MEGSKLIRSAYTGVTVSEALIGCVVYERAQGQVDIATSAAVEPLGVVTNIQPDGRLVIAGAGTFASVLLSEDFEYSDTMEFSATTGGAAAVYAPTTSATYSVGRIVLPYETKGSLGSMQECFIFPQYHAAESA